MIAIPMFFFEYSALGSAFALTRLAANIPAILLVSLILSRLTRREEVAALAPAPAE